MKTRKGAPVTAPNRALRDVSGGPANQGAGRSGLAATIAVLAFCCVADHAQLQARPRPAPAKGTVGAAASAASVDSETCATCHGDLVEAFAHRPHVALDRGDGAAAWGKGDSSCASCHANAEAHADQADPSLVFAFDGTALQNSRVCLDCHHSDHPRFARSSHAKAGLGCLDCHSVHGKAPPESVARFGTTSAGQPDAGFAGDLAGRPSATCATCHQSALTSFAFTDHHRLLEGSLECTSCHDPHGPSSRLHLASSRQATCAQCHADKQGPFVFEHDAQRVEGCTACHSPHGSPNRHMLQFQQVAEQCYSCHAQVPGFHTRFTADTQCTSCHSQIHGSNLHPAFLQ